MPATSEVVSELPRRRSAIDPMPCHATEDDGRIDNRAIPRRFAAAVWRWASAVVLVSPHDPSARNRRPGADERPPWAITDVSVTKLVWVARARRVPGHRVPSVRRNRHRVAEAARPTVLARIETLIVGAAAQRRDLPGARQRKNPAIRSR